MQIDFRKIQQILFFTQPIGFPAKFRINCHDIVVNIHENLKQK